MITWRPAALLLAGSVPVLAFRSPVLALVVLGLVVLVVAIDVLAAARPAHLALRRDGDRQVRIGADAHVALHVTNNGRRSFAGTVRDVWVPSAGAGSDRYDVSLAPGESTVLATTLHPTRRGDRPAVRVMLRAYGPLRCAYRQNSVRSAVAATPPWTLRVMPRFDSRRLLPEKVARLRVFDGATVTRGRGEGTEFDALREYVVGDDVRSIDWRGTARRQDVVVRTWRPERDRHVICVVDTGRTSAIRVGTTSVDPGDEGLDEPRLDAAIDAVLLLAEVATRAGDSVSMIAVDTEVRAEVTGRGHRSLLRPIAAALAPLQPSLVETDFGLVVGEILRRERKRALVVLFTALEPGALGESLLPALAQLTARHSVLVAAVSDPALDEMAGERGTVAGVYRSVAAHRTLAERSRIAQQLRRRTVEVVDAPVSQYASRVTDAYLSMKATGQL
ncbi:MAG TPA: DUF58 domain-containing protein [Micromonosporaceae bacterium]|jgi:uncharacterized protein (DUF58 family)